MCKLVLQRVPSMSYHHDYDDNEYHNYGRDHKHLEYEHKQYHFRNDDNSCVLGLGLLDLRRWLG